MIAKKNPKADLEKKRFAFFQIGLLVSGSLCLAAFEYSSATDETSKIEVSEYMEEALAVEEVYDFTEEIPKQEVQKRASFIRMDTEVKPVDTEPNPNLGATDGDKVEFDEGDGEDCIDCGYGIAESDDIIHEIVGIEPSFPGGEGAMANWINDNIELPDYIPTYDQGTVYVQFVVNKDGSIEQVNILKGLSYELDRAAKKVVNKMPKWSPGEQAGKPVRVRFTLPINIVLS